MLNTFMVIVLVSSIFFMGASFVVMCVYKYYPDVWNELESKKQEFRQLSLKALDFVKEDLYNPDGSLKDIDDSVVNKIEQKEKWFLKYFGDNYIKTSRLYVSTENLSDVFSCDISKDFLKWLDK